MNNKPQYRVTAKVGEYVGDDGKPKARYTTVGAAWERDGRISVKIESKPLNWDGWLTLFPNERDDGQKPRSSNQSAPSRRDPPQQGSYNDMPDDDIPF